MYTSTTVRRSDDFFSVRGKSVVPFFPAAFSSDNSLSLSSKAIFQVFWTTRCLDCWDVSFKGFIYEKAIEPPFRDCLKSISTHCCPRIFPNVNMLAFYKEALGLSES